MRIAVVSDIHANLPALRAIQGQITETDMIVCLGDLIGYYCQVNEVLDWIRTRDVFCVRGNHAATCSSPATVKAYRLPCASASIMPTGS